MPTVTVDVDNWASKARLRCPHPHTPHTSWRPHEDSFYCFSCNRAYDELVDAKTGRRVTRSEVELRRGR